MPLFVVRVWLPDRPGALGSVASRIGAVRGDLIGIDILERGAGRAIDELVIDLPDAELVGLLTRELSEVEGVDVEDVRPLSDVSHDPRLDALESAIAIVEARSVGQLLRLLAEQAAIDFEADWTAVIDLDGMKVEGSSGLIPDMAWMYAFISGSRASVDAAVDDVAWSPMASSDLTLLLGRKGRPLRSRERRQATALARIADTRWVELSR
jgi:hypothetical protein